ncbi:MAG: DUF2190 family protein [Candidatus Bathyarchaeota archaeon]|nr:DUF2190 family protein [Candidatus Bathyarchaeota archaeon]
MTDRSGKSWMAIGETDDPEAIIESYEAEAAVTKGSPVHLSSDDKVSESPGGDDAIGIAVKTVAAGAMCGVLKRGRVKVTANGPITRGKAVCSAAGRKVTQFVDQAVNEGGAATYTVYYNRKLGTALQAAVADGDLIFIDVEK